MQGLHLTADLAGCPVEPPAFTDPAALRSLCLQAVAGSGLRPVGELFHRFDGGGYAFARRYARADHERRLKCLARWR